MNIPEELCYTKEHEWARMECDLCVVGITDYAQGELGDMVYVELPEPGTQGRIWRGRVREDGFRPLFADRRGDRGNQRRARRQPGTGQRFPV